MFDMFEVVKSKFICEKIQIRRQCFIMIYHSPHHIVLHYFSRP
jgi:hypothetical protein